MPSVWKRLLLFAGLASLPPISDFEALASWEASAQVGFDSNVNLSIQDPQADGYFSGALSFLRGPSGESRLDWTFASAVEGGVYAETEDLAFASLRIAPGLRYVPHYGWTLSVFPFLQGKTVKDADQTALSFGVRGSLEERVGRLWYVGQEYMYTVNRAETETYSFHEHLFGLYLGADWTERLSSEVGYEYARGDSFRTVGISSGQTTGRGRHRRYSDTFGADVVREKVDRHAATVRFGIGWTGSLFSQVSYEFAVLNGDLGSVDSHNVFFATGLRF